MHMSQNLLVEELQKKIEGYGAEIKKEKVGHIVSVGDGIVRAVGLADVMVSEMVQFANGKFGVALNLEEDSVGIMVLGYDHDLHEGDEVKSTGKLLQVPVGKALLGRVVNALGEPIDGKGALKGAEMRFIEQEARGVIERQSVNEPLYTGLKAIDAMIPVGRGQRELIIGDRQTGKTAIVADTILRQLTIPVENRPYCIYVAVGQKQSRVARLVHELEKRGAMEYTIVVNATASDPAALLFLAPYAGVTMGEYFRDKGEDAVIFYDDLTKHAWAYRQISALLRRPPGREAYPGDIFYLHSRLLERSSKLSEELGGGSLTAFPIVETQAGDISGYIPTNIISITDGQIYLEPNLFNKGVRPAINVGLSVSRVGSAAQIKAMKKVAGTLRLDLAQFRELEAFAQFGSELDKKTQEKLNRGQRVTEVLKQVQYDPMGAEEQVLVIYAATKGYIDDIEVKKVGLFEKGLREYATGQARKVLDAIATKKVLDEEIERDIIDTIESYKKLFIKEHGSSTGTTTKN